MTLGQEFAAFAVTLAEDKDRLREARLLLHELNLGGAAIGTELNTRPEYRRCDVAHLREAGRLDHSGQRQRPEHFIRLAGGVEPELVVGQPNASTDAWTASR
jgi:aspartate ammonia-lyase